MIDWLLFGLYGNWIDVTVFGWTEIFRDVIVMY